jgi:sulfite exporter TauE/SafE
MMTLIAVICLGFFLGMRHATDPDHVIAITTIVSRQRSVKHAALIGIFWGLGHTFTIFVVGAAIILFSVVIPVRVGLTMEFSVGLMLVVLGILNLTGIMAWINENLTPVHGQREIVHSHAHTHEGYVHTHSHVHLPASQDLSDGSTYHHDDSSGAPGGGVARLLARVGLYQLLRPLVVGVVHGLAGSAAIALLVLTTIQNPYWAVAYLLVFGLGTIAGMMLITAAIAVPFAYTGQRFARLNRGLAVASGLLSLAFGLFIAYHIGFVNGLFTRHPHWIPR